MGCNNSSEGGQSVRLNRSAASKGPPKPRDAQTSSCQGGSNVEGGLPEPSVAHLHSQLDLQLDSREAVSRLSIRELKDVIRTHGADPTSYRRVC